MALAALATLASAGLASGCASLLGDFSTGADTGDASNDGSFAIDAATDVAASEGGAGDAGARDGASHDTGSTAGCTGAASQACGNCGTQTRTCDSATGTWSAWTACTGEGVCSPNTTQSCGAGGMQSCGGNCMWGQCGNQTCVGADSQACGNCGTQTRTCDNATATWSAWSACAGEGECAVNTTQACGTGGTQSCGGNCMWGQCANQMCSGAASQPCGNCGTQTRTCDTTTGTWSAWSACAGEGVCAPMATQACGSNGTETCDPTTCKWGQCVCAGSTSMACQCNGTQTRTCNAGTWSAWSACSGGANTMSDPANCGSCGHMCPSVSSPGYGKCAGGACIGDIGGYVETLGTYSLDAQGDTQYAVQAYLPVSAVLSSLSAKLTNYSSSGGSLTLALWADNGSQTAPGNLLFSGQASLNQDSAPDLYTVTGDGRTLSPGMYWVSSHPPYTGSPPSASLSNSPCVASSWMNIDPPAAWSYASNPTTCGSLEQYMTVVF